MAAMRLFYGAGRWCRAGAVVTIVFAARRCGADGQSRIRLGMVKTSPWEAGADGHVIIQHCLAQTKDFMLFRMNEARIQLSRRLGEEGIEKEKIWLL
jgi:hypothetical protein